MLERVLGALAWAGRAAASLQVVLEVNQPLQSRATSLLPLLTRQADRGSEVQRDGSPPRFLIL